MENSVSNQTKNTSCVQIDGMENSPTTWDKDGSKSTNPKNSIGGKIRRGLRHNALLLVTLCGVILGFGLGFGFRQHELSELGLMWLGKTWDLQIGQFSKRAKCIKGLFCPPLSLPMRL